VGFGKKIEYTLQSTNSLIFLAISRVLQHPGGQKEHPTKLVFTQNVIDG
jgi:hypothetical protein